jgi:hypothetical protein
VGIKPKWVTRATIRASSSPSLKPAKADARTLYERVYCARGEMENRIKECQLDLGGRGRTRGPTAPRRPLASEEMVEFLASGAPERPATSLAQARRGDEVAIGTVG